MYTKIIAGHDLHDGGRDAVALGKQLADATGAKLVVAGVFPIAVQPFAFEPEWHEEEEQLAAAIQKAADEAGAEAKAFPSGSSARGLHDFAEEIGADLVIVGSSKRSKIGEVLAGNVGLSLLHGSPCPVALAPRGYHERDARLSTVVVGIDGNPESDLALREAVALAKAGGAALKLVAAAEPPPIVYYGKGGGAGQGYAELKQAIEEQARTALAAAKASVPDDVECEATLVSGEPAKTLVEAGAGAGAGAILVLGSRAYGPVRRVLLGSVSSAVMRSARCPVLVHPRGVRAEDAAAETAEAGSAA